MISPQVRFRALDSMTKVIFPNLICVSEPIKVISKPDQLAKKQTQKTKKRNVSDLLVETLLRIEEQQNEQQKLLMRLSQKVEKVEQDKARIEQQGKMRKFFETKLNKSTDSAETSEDFETTFLSFLNAFNNFPPDERPAKIRKLIRGTPAHDFDQLSELLDMFLIEGNVLGRENSRRENHQSHGVQALKPCEITECPHKKELEKIDDFYKEFLSNSYLNMS